MGTITQQDNRAGVPIRPIVSSRGTITYETAKELPRILKPLVRRPPLHVHNSRDFVKQIKDIKLHQDEYIISFDVKGLFASVPIVPTIKIIKDKLEQDSELQQKHQ